MNKKEVQKQEQSTEVQAAHTQSEIVESLVLNGDLSKMSPPQRVGYYNDLCHALGINPLMQPFEIINLKGKLKMYATKSCAEQLRRINGISVTDLKREQVGTQLIFTCYVTDKTGRTDVASSAVDIQGLSGEALSNLYMKGETKSKRRATLSISGLGILDETEVQSIVDTEATIINDDAPMQPNSIPLASQQDYESIMRLLTDDHCPDLVFDNQPVEVVIKGITDLFMKNQLQKNNADQYIDYLEKLIAHYKQTQEGGL